MADQFYLTRPKEFVNVCDEQLDLLSDDEKKEIEKKNTDSKDLLDAMKEALGDAVSQVRFTKSLANHPVCLSSEGGVSLGMEKVLNKMPGVEKNIKAQIILEVNADHPIASKLQSLFGEDKSKLEDYTKILYAQARLIGGMTLDNPTEITDLICNIIA